MKSKVIKIADLNQFEVNPEYKNITVTDEEIQSQIEGMALNFGKTVSVDALEENCCVACKSSDGDKVLLYPFLQISGLEKAVSDVKDKAVGDTFSTTIMEKEITLIVESFMANRSLEINDDLPKACGVEVSSLEELRKYLTEKETEKKLNNNVRTLVMEYIEFIFNNSEVEVDEEEAKAWAIPQAKKVYEEELSYGIDLRFTEDGEMLTEEEALSRLADELSTQFVANLIQEQFAKDMGFVPTGDEEAGNPYDMFMYQYLSSKAMEALS